MVGSAGCGNGVPMWFQKKAAPELIGKPLETKFPYSLVMPVDKVSPPLFVLSLLARVLKPQVLLVRRSVATRIAEQTNRCGLCTPGTPTTIFSTRAAKR